MTRIQIVNTVSDNIRHLREQRGWTISELARQCKIARSHISRFESGDRLPDICSLMKLSKGLKVSVTTILRGIQ